jgi:hypothetical protein
MYEERYAESAYRRQEKNAESFVIRPTQVEMLKDNGNNDDSNYPYYRS